MKQQLAGLSLAAAFFVHALRKLRVEHEDELKDGRSAWEDETEEAEQKAEEAEQKAEEAEQKAEQLKRRLRYGDHCPICPICPIDD